ncbi:MAG: hypothetical protein KDA44_11335 [Planctomycetales bacterium]|nr:hypothetical protein [Planctomycetales bacterium]
MRILFVGGFYRGHLLAKRLLERGENVVGAFVFREDAHETVQFNEQIASQFAAHNIWTKVTRKISASDVSMISERFAPDVIFCLGWRTLIPTDVLQSAPRGGVAVHDSLLPRLRGFAPTNWGLILGHDQLGATLFQLADSVDAGDVYFQCAITPAPHESYESIQDRIAQASVELFDSYLDAARDGTLRGVPQDQTQATFTCARGPADGEIDWSASSLQIERSVRALGPPAPGAFTFLDGSPLVITQARQLTDPPAYEGRIPGRVVGRNVEPGTIDVLCGAGVLRIDRVHTATGDSRPAAAVVASVRQTLGMNHSQEIIQLRERLAAMENRLACLEAPTRLASAG